MGLEKIFPNYLFLNAPKRIKNYRTIHKIQMNKTIMTPLLPVKMTMMNKKAPDFSNSWDPLEVFRKIISHLQPNMFTNLELKCAKIMSFMAPANTETNVHLLMENIK